MRKTSLAAHHDFPGIVGVRRVTSRRRLRGKPADTAAVRYCFLSKYISPKPLLHAARTHWGIENQLHWVLDVHFAEDGNRARNSEDLAITHNILRTHPDSASIQRKIKRTGWDDAFLLSTLSHMR